MKKLLKIFLVFIGLFILVGCGNQSASSSESSSVSETAQEEQKVIKLGVNPLRDQIAEAARPYIEEAGYELEVVVVTDPVQLNEALQDGTVDLNFQQHEIYMEQFNEERGGDLVKVGDKLYSQVVGLFSNNYDSLNQIQDGDKITIQNDATNRDRALKLLHDSDLITLAEKAEDDTEAYSLLDIEENPKNLEFVEVSAEALVRMLEDTDAAVLTGMNAAKGGFNADDALAVYDRDDKDKYALILSAKAGSENTEWAKTVYEALQTEEAQAAVKEVTNGAWTPMF